MPLPLRVRVVPAALLAVAALGGATAALADQEKPGKPLAPVQTELTGRAIYSATQYQPGPVSGFGVTGDLNGVSIPFGGQPIPGFSAVKAIGGGRFIGMPDNGFGAKTNSADFELRAYVVRPDFKTGRGGSGAVDVLRTIHLRDPDQRVLFPLTRVDRVLTGADFDLESLEIGKDGSLWFGEEFGPFLLHTDRTGKVLEAPVPLPGVQSPQFPGLADPAAATQPASGGFEAMAASVNGRTLYPTLEKARIGETDPRRRVINEFDVRTRRYTGKTWIYRVDEAFPNALLGDAVALDAHRLLFIERDDAQGADAKQKKLYVVDLRKTDADGALKKTLVADLLDIADPRGVSSPARPGEFGVGARFSFPLQSVESVEYLGGDKLLVANDNNFPGSDGRWTARDKPDDIELITLRVPGLER